MFRRRFLTASVAYVIGLAQPLPALAIGEPSFISDSAVRGGVPIVAAGRAAPIIVDADDHAGVRRAAADLQMDVERVTGARPELIAGTIPRMRQAVGTP